MDIKLNEAKHANLIRLWQENRNSDVIEAIWADFAPFVCKQVRIVLNTSGVSVAHKDDLMQECALALIEAVKRHDSAKNPKLTPYLTSYIKNRLKRYVLDFKGPCRLGTNTKDRQAYYDAQRLKAEKAAQGNFETLGERDVADLARRNNISLHTARRAIQAISPQTTDVTPDMLVQDPTALTSSDMIKLLDLARPALQDLDARTQDVLCHMFDKQSGVEKMSQRYTISNRRVRQIQKEGLDILKEYIAQETGIDAL